MTKILRLSTQSNKQRAFSKTKKNSIWHEKDQGGEKRPKKTIGSKTILGGQRNIPTKGKDGKRRTKSDLKENEHRFQNKKAILGDIPAIG